MLFVQRRGFTLIELLIAIGLGSTIVMVAASGLRVAAQTITAAERLARKNELIAVGMLSAFDELDFWNSYDDPQGGSARQRLRASCRPPGALSTYDSPLPAAPQPLLLGLPFAPFARSVNGFAPVWTAGISQDFGLGWQDDERLWAMSADNELSWWPGNKAETMETDCRFGHYAIFGLSRHPAEAMVKIDGGTSWAVGGWQPRNGGGAYGQLAFGTEPTPPAPSANQVVGSYRHQAPGWLYNQIHGLSNAIGWYGMLDYLPANTIDCYSTQYRPMVGTTNWGASPGDSTDAAGRPMFMINSWTFQDKPWFALEAFSPNWAPHGMDFLTSYTAYSLVPVNDNQFEASGTALTTEQLSFYNRTYARMEMSDMPIGGWGGNDTNQFVEPQYPSNTAMTGDPAFNAFVSRTTASRPLLQQHPAAWPSVAVSAARYLRLCRYSTQLKVAWSDPLNGERADIRFTAMGTTLRGARRQRNLDQ